MTSGTVPPATISKRSAQRKVLGRILRNFRFRGEGQATVLCLPGRSGWDIRYLQSCPEVGHIVAVERERHIRARMSRLKAWVQHLEAGGPRTAFRGYAWAIKSGYRQYEDAVKELRAFESQVVLGMYEDVAPWPYFLDVPPDDAEAIALRSGGYDPAVRR